MPIKFVPVITTDVPLLPTVGVKDEIVGTRFVGGTVGVKGLFEFEHLIKEKITNIRSKYFFILFSWLVDKICIYWKK